MKKKSKSTPKRPPGFVCDHCQQWVAITPRMGTRYRNHCPNCLHSKHVGQQGRGDRGTFCSGAMEPIGLTFKHEGMDKYSGKPRQGEIMLIHQCRRCNQTSINRIAADDDPQSILLVLEKSAFLDQQTRSTLKENQIDYLTKKDLAEVKKQLFGSNS